MVKSNSAVLAGLGVVVVWASAFPAIQVAVPAMGFVGLSFARLAIASIVLLAVTPFAHVRLPRARDLGWVLACAFFGMTAYQLLLNRGELRVPAGTASIIVAAAPIVSVAVARILFSERVTVFTVSGSAVALGGVIVVCLARSGVSVSTAALVVVGAMAAQGIYHPLQKPLLRRYSGLEVATYTMIAGTLMTAPLLPWGWTGLVSAPPTGWAAAAYLGIVPSALGFVLWGFAVGRLPVAVSTSLLYLAPAVAVFIAWAWLHQLPVPADLIGGVIIMAGVVIVAQGANIARLILPSRTSEASGNDAADTHSPLRHRSSAPQP
jgi:drug/metabolite transporter (DMT)-like permease